MADLAVITPSRGRPEQLRQMVESVFSTATGSVDMWIGLDADDPADYSVVGSVPLDWMLHVVKGERRSLSAWTNYLAEVALRSNEPPRYLASLGDDHRPRTKGWDRILCDAAGDGIAYGNDLLQGRNLPTAWVTSAGIVRGLGWLMLPTCQHMYVDNATLALGQALNAITYRPDVVIEHLHPIAGKAQWDESYRESNTDARYAADRQAFEQWRRTGLAEDVARVRALSTSAGKDHYRTNSASSVVPR